VSGLAACFCHHFSSFFSVPLPALWAVLFLHLVVWQSAHEALSALRLAEMEQERSRTGTLGMTGSLHNTRWVGERTFVRRNR
jgi:hypothetical protein